MQLLLAHYNPFCTPPWSEAELRHKCEDADAKLFEKPRGWLLRETASGESVTPSELPEIVVTTAEHLVNEAAAAALAADPQLFQRAGGLVTVRLGDGTASIELVPAPVVRDKLTRFSKFVRLKAGGAGEPVRVPAHPPDWWVANVAARGDYPGVRRLDAKSGDEVRALAARGDYPGVRRLDGVVGFPVLGPCGRVLDGGYHESIRTFVAPGGVELHLPHRPTRGDAAAAAERLADLVAEFPFKTRAHFSAWLAALLTLLARPGFRGPTPFVLIDANAPAAGKGKLANVLHRILTGRDFPVTPFPREEREMDTRLTGLALSGARLVCFDNLTGRVGSANLDAAMTGSYWAGRPLYSNYSPALPLDAVFYGTGNNVRLHGDLARRTLHVRLEVGEERPDERQFRIADIAGHAGENRAGFLTDALTILAAYCAMDRPRHGLRDWGSFEAWSRIVREAVVFAGLPDPAETRDELRAGSDRDAEVMGSVLAGLLAIDPSGRGVTSAEIAETVKDDLGRRRKFRAALEELCEPKPVSSSRIGYTLRGFLERNFGGLTLTRSSETRSGSTVWVAIRAAGAELLDAGVRGGVDVTPTRERVPIEPARTGTWGDQEFTPGSRGVGKAPKSKAAKL